MTQYVVEAPDGSRHIIEGPDAPPQGAPAGQDKGAALAGVNSALDIASLGLYSKAAPYIAAGASHLMPGPNISVPQAQQAYDANNAATLTAHPVARVAGDVAGFGIGLPIGGAAIEGARLIPGVARAANAVAKAGPVTRALATAGTDAAVGAGTGYVQGGEPGAVAGAIAGPVAGAAARGVLNTAGPAAFKLLAKTVKLPDESLDAAASRLTDNFNEFKTRFGYAPALAQLVDATQAKEISSTIGRRASASQMAANAEESSAEQLQHGLSSAIATPRPTATAAQGDVEAAATKDFDKTMGQIDKQRVAISPQQTTVLEANAKDLRRVMQGTSYDSARSALDDHLEQGTAPTLRDVETWRQAADRGSKNIDPVVAHNYAAVKADVRNIGENVPEYKDLMARYEQHMAFAENIPEGAKGMTAAPLDFNAGFRNQPSSPTPIFPGKLAVTPDTAQPWNRPTFKYSTNGAMIVGDVDKAGNYRITTSAATQPGAGSGALAYEGLAHEAASRGVAVHSDSEVTAPAAAIYGKLANKGFAVSRDPTATFDGTKWTTTNGQPVFTISGISKAAVTGDAARAGQSVGLRTALSQKALQSPNAAAALSRDITQNAALRQNIATALPEAAETQRAGEMAYKAGRGMAAAVPVQRTQAQETAEASSQALRAGLLGVHGGSSSFMAHVVEHAVNKFGLPLGTAKKVAQLATDPANTPAVLQYLRVRGTTAAQRHEFMNLVRGGAAAAAGSAAGATQ